MNKGQWSQDERVYVARVRRRGLPPQEKSAAIKVWGALYAWELSSVLSGRDRVGVEEVTHQGMGHMKKNWFEMQKNERSERAQSGVREIPGREITMYAWSAGERSGCSTDLRSSILCGKKSDGHEQGCPGRGGGMNSRATMA